MSARAEITGNMGKPIALTFTNSGKPVASFSLADTPRRKNQQTGEWEDSGETLWVDVSVWDDAEFLTEKFPDFKGRATVTGRLGVRSYQAKDGTTKTAVTLNADSVAFHAPRDRQQSQRPAPAQQPTQGDPWGQQQPQGGNWNTPTNDPAPF